jgi:hypothetical protein
MPHAFLPIDGRTHLCHTEGHKVQALADAPGMDDADFSFSPDGFSFSVLDHGKRRAGLFRLLPEAPWFERVLPFASLPKACKGHAHAVVADNLLVGGRGNKEESLWIRSTADGDRWRAVPIPEKVRRPGKAIDGLLIEGGRIIAVDNIVQPKWLIIYEPDGAGSLQPLKVVKLPAHTSYENIQRCALGPGMIGLISRGINHGISSCFVSILESSKFKERAVWSAARSPREDASESHVPPPIMNASDLGFFGNNLVVACRESGLLISDLRSRSSDSGASDSSFRSSHPAGPSLRLLNIPSLTSTDRLVMPLGEDAGFFAVGIGLDGEKAYAWVEPG